MYRPQRHRRSSLHSPQNELTQVGEVYRKRRSKYIALYKEKAIRVMDYGTILLTFLLDLFFTEICAAYVPIFNFQYAGLNFSLF